MNRPDDTREVPVNVETLKSLMGATARERESLIQAADLVKRSMALLQTQLDAVAAVATGASVMAHALHDILLDKGIATRLELEARSRTVAGQCGAQNLMPDPTTEAGEEPRTQTNPAHS